MKKIKTFLFLSLVAILCLFTVEVRAETLSSHLEILQKQLEAQNLKQSAENIKAINEGLELVIQGKLSEAERSELKDIKYALSMVEKHLEANQPEKGLELLIGINEKLSRSGIGLIIIPLPEKIGLRELTNEEMQKITGPETRIESVQKTETKKSKKNFFKKYGLWVGGVVILGIIINQKENPSPPKENLPPVPVE
jgi:hypothetical protein